MQTFLRWTVYLPAMAIGVVLLVAWWHVPFAIALADGMRSELGRLLGACVAGILLIMPCALVLRWWQVARRSREISYTTESGKVSVNLIAIEEALTRTIEGEPEVKKAHVRVYEDRVKRTVVIEATATLWEVPNVTERNRACQRLLRRRFAELMPEQAQVEVNLSIHRLHVRPPPSPEPAPAPAKAKDRSNRLAAVAPATAATVAPAPPSPRRQASELPFEPNGEDELYAGPSYPVLPDEEEGGTGMYHAKPKPKPGR